MDFTNKTLLEEFDNKLGWSIDSVTLWTYVKKGFIKPSSYLQDGKRVVPVYYKSDFPHLVKTLKLLAKLGRVKIKGYDKKGKIGSKAKKRSVESI